MMSLIKTIACQLALVAVAHLNGHAQMNSPTTPQLPSVPVVSEAGIEVRIIDEAGVQALLAQSTKPLRLFTIVTRYCGATPGALAYEEHLVKNYPDQVDHWVLISAKEKNARKVVERLKELEFRGPVYLIDDQYKSKGTDERQKGTNFRNALCEPCRGEVIGVPYRLLYSRDNQILLHGYLFSEKYSPQNVGIPADFVGHFVKLISGNASD